MATAQLESVLRRRLPSSAESALMGRMPTLYGRTAATQDRAAQERNLALQRQTSAQSAEYGRNALDMQDREQEELKRQGKTSEMAGYGNMALTAGLGGAKYGGTIMNALGIGGGAQAAAAGSALGVPTAAAAGGIAEGTATSLALGPGTGGAGALSSGGAGGLATGLGYAAPAATGFLGGNIAAGIGGGKSTTTRAAKGLLGGALAGAGTGAALGSMGLPGPGTVAGGVIGGVVGAVTQALGGGGGGGGSVICTLLARHGLLDRHLYEVESAWAMSNLPAHVLRGYHAWAVPLTRKMETSPRLRRLAARVVNPYARHIARKAGARQYRPSLTGAVISAVGTFLCGLLGRFLRHDAFDPRWDREDSDRLEGACHESR
jgi:hypothetical protein